MNPDPQHRVGRRMLFFSMRRQAGGRGVIRISWVLTVNDGVIENNFCRVPKFSVFFYSDRNFYLLFYYLG